MPTRPMPIRPTPGGPSTGRPGAGYPTRPGNPSTGRPDRPGWTPGRPGYRPPTDGGRPPSHHPGWRPPHHHPGYRPPHRPGHRPPYYRPGHNRPGWGWNGHRIRAGFFHYPAGYGYRTWAVGATLPAIFLGASYFFNDYATLGLDAPPYGYQWVRYGPDVLLVNLRTGRVEAVERGVFY